MNFSETNTMTLVPIVPVRERKWNLTGIRNRRRRGLRTALMVLLATSVLVSFSFSPFNCFAEDAVESSDAILQVDAFKACLSQMEADALLRVSKATFLAVLSDLEPDLSILSLLENQPEFDQPIWGYLDDSVTATKVAIGRRLLEAHRSLFDSVESLYGVDRTVIAAVWGIETNFGAGMGRRPVLQATGTLACNGRRKRYFRDEFLAALEILEHGDIDRDRFRGSWSGAFGGTQFMPTNLIKYGVDYDSDGRRDIINSVPDIIASTANILKAYGWIKGRDCFYEASLSADFDFSQLSLPMMFGQWRRAGVTLTVDKISPSEEELLKLSLPAGLQGPAFLLTSNFGAILRYNPADSYAYAVCYLQARLAGGEPFKASWPRDQRMLSRDERYELQALLSSRGLAVGPIDGMIGDQTRAGISAFQQQSGLKPDGFPTAALLNRLRQP
jgi:membrane-bound lytic murein transglycosylase B